MPLLRALEDTGWSVFWDRTIPVGRTWRNAIGKEIDNCRCMIVVWSQRSVDSDWVHEEADEGKRRGVLAPVLIDHILPPLGFRSIQSAKLADWDGKAPSTEFDRLLADLSNILGTAPAKVEQQRQVELEASRKAEEEATRAREQAAKKAEAQQRQEVEAKRVAEETARRKTQAEQQQRAEQEAIRKANEEAKRKAEEEASQERERAVKEAEQQHKSKQEAQRKQEEEAARRKAAQAAASKTTEPPPATVTPNGSRPMPIKLIALGGITLAVIALAVKISVSERDHDPTPADVTPSRVIPDASHIELQRDVERREREQSMADLLVQGAEAEAALRLTTPEHDNAVGYYREVLTLDSGNRDAHEGLKRVTERYIAWAEQALAQRRFGKVEDNLAKAQSVDPDHPALRRLASDLQEEQAPASDRQLTGGKVFRDKLKDGGKGPEMVMIPAGSFRMGDIQGVGGKDELEVHEVRIARPFAMGRYEVTFAEYDEFARATGRRLPDDSGWGRGRQPVIYVLWQDAVAYAEWLTEQTGKRYRLPSEAEWEYAARAHEETAYWWGNEMQVGMANCYGCDGRWGEKQKAPVGSFPANPFGLFDTAGNVWEWVQDCWHESYKDAPKDGSAWLEAKAGDCGRRVHRGGSWYFIPRSLRSSSRNRDFTVVRSNTIGFRLAQDLD